MSEDRCVICGEIVPEGRMVCPDCEAGKKTLTQLIDGRFCTPLIFEPSLTKDACPMCKRPFKGFVEQKKGKWIIDGHHIECNRCGTYMCYTDREGDKFPTNFCPNCGADMREEETNEI